MSTMAEPQRTQTAHLYMLIQRSPCSCSCAAEPLTMDARSRMRGVCSRCAPQAPLSCLLRRRACRMRHSSAPHVIYVFSACAAACSARMCLCRRSPWREAYFHGSLVRDPDMLPRLPPPASGRAGAHASCRALVSLHVQQRLVSVLSPPPSWPVLPVQKWGPR
jgi:hypothetical protein